MLVLVCTSNDRKLLIDMVQNGEICWNFQINTEQPLWSTTKWVFFQSQISSQNIWRKGFWSIPFYEKTSFTVSWCKHKKSNWYVLFSDFQDYAGSKLRVVSIHSALARIAVLLSRCIVLTQICVDIFFMLFISFFNF